LPLKRNQIKRRSQNDKLKSSAMSPAFLFKRRHFNDMLSANLKGNYLNQTCSLNISDEILKLGQKTFDSNNIPSILNTLCFNVMQRKYFQNLIFFKMHPRMIKNLFSSMLE
jgi:hypothetical protein